jgi:excinuclease UvrABC ATPase subunit
MPSNDLDTQPFQSGNGGGEIVVAGTPEESVREKRS